MVTSQVENDISTQNKNLSRKEKLSLVFLLIQTVASGLVCKSLAIVASNFGVSLFQIFLIFFFVFISALSKFLKSTVIALIDIRMTNFLKKIRYISFINCLISLLAIVGKVSLYVIIKQIYLTKKLLLNISLIISILKKEYNII